MVTSLKKTSKCVFLGGIVEKIKYENGYKMQDTSMGRWSMSTKLIN